MNNIKTRILKIDGLKFVRFHLYEFLEYLIYWNMEETTDNEIRTAYKKYLKIRKNKI